MSNINRQEKINILRIKAKRKQIVSQINNLIPINIESFLSIEETINLTDKVYKKLDYFNNQIEISKNFKTNLNLLLTTLEENKKNFDNEVVVFHHNDRETGALILKLQYVWNNLEEVLLFVGFKSGYRDLVIVDKILKFGICIERHEYYNNLIVWNT